MTIDDILAPGGTLGDDHGPRYLVLRRRLEAAMDGGHLAPGDPLPPEREIARITGTSRVTVRKAIEDLAQSGRVVQRRGSGSFVGDPTTAAPAAKSNGARPAKPAAPTAEHAGRLASVSEELAMRGVTTTVQVIEAALVEPGPDEIQALGLSPGETMARLVRLRLADGTPIAVETTLLPGDVMPKPKKAGKSLYAALEKSGNRPSRAIQRIGATALSKTEAKTLGAKKGDAALAVERTGYLASGRIVEITQALFLAGHFDVVAELKAAGASK